MRSYILAKISYHAVYDESIIEALRFALDTGFTGVQAAIETPHLSFVRLRDQEIDEVRSFRGQHGLRLILHAHDETASLWESNRHLREGIRTYYRALIEFARRVGAQMVTIHLGSPALYGTDTEPRRMLPDIDQRLYREALVENLDFLAEASSGGPLVCIENERLNPIARGVLQGYLERGAFGLCWDLAKMYNRDMEIDSALERYFWDNARYVRQVHLHDRIPDGSSHRVIGTGMIDFRGYLERLSGYDIVDYCIEVRPRDKAKESLERLKRLVTG
jgi:sugar phosphate isomerase/epimerase